MSIDMRGFVYALEPIRKKNRWELDALQARLGKAQADVDKAQASLNELLGAYARTAADASGCAAEAFDPFRHRRQVAYLRLLHQRIETQREDTDNLRSIRDSLRAGCNAKQQALELLDGHRDRCKERYRHDEQVRQSAEADRDWIARSQWRAGAEPVRDATAGCSGGTPW